LRHVIILTGPLPHSPPSFLPFPLSAKTSKFTDPTTTIGTSLGVNRELGWRVRKEAQVQVSQESRSYVTPACSYRQRSAGYVYACRVRMRCDVTSLPLWGLVALRLSHKIRLQLTEGSRMQQLLTNRSRRWNLKANFPWHSFLPLVERASSGRRAGVYSCPFVV
jgi:hypothetical protein